MPGEPDPLHVAARTILLDTLEALGAQRDAVILIGAQAIYMHTGSIEFAVAEYTTDADVAIDPGLLHDDPEIESALTAAGFSRAGRVGAWVIIKQVDGNSVNGHLIGVRAIAATQSPLITALSPVVLTRRPR